MRLLGFSILLSLIIHLLLTVLLNQLEKLYSIPYILNKITFTLIDNRVNQDIPQYPEMKENASESLLLGDFFPADSSDEADQTDNTPLPDSLIEARALQYAFLHHSSDQKINDLSPDSLRSSILNSLHPMTPSQGDPVEKFIRQRNTGIEPLLFNLSDMVPGRSEKFKRELNLDFIPTEGQIRALNQLFIKGPLQDTELYPILNSGDFKTYGMYRDEMDRIVDKGLVSREKVSPEQLFILFVIPIEMSRKNIKNPEYCYEPLFSKKMLIDYLQSRLFALQHAEVNSNMDSTKKVLQMEDIAKKLSILLE